MDKNYYRKIEDEYQITEVAQQITWLNTLLKTYGGRTLENILQGLKAKKQYLQEQFDKKYGRQE